MWRKDVKAASTRPWTGNAPQPCAPSADPRLPVRGSAKFQGPSSKQQPDSGFRRSGICHPSSTILHPRPGERRNLIRRRRSLSGTLNETRFVLRDYLDPVAIITSAGVVDERYGYEAFGPVRVMDANFATRSSSTCAWNWLYHGEFLDGESGMYDYGYRFYHPALGRWASRDPIGERGGVNLYGFVGNSGIGKVDIHGLIVDLNRLKESNGISDAIRDERLVPIPGMHGWTDVSNCDKCRVRFTFQEAYIGSSTAPRASSVDGIYIYLKGELLDEGDECQDVKIIQYGRFITSHNRKLASGAPTDLNNVKNKSGWWVDADDGMKAAGNPYVSSTAFSTTDGDTFDLFDSPGNTRDREKRGVEFMTCVSARCKKDGTFGKRRTLACLHWGVLPEKTGGEGNVPKMSVLKGTPKILCNEGEEIMPKAGDAALDKWLREHGQ